MKSSSVHVRLLGSCAAFNQMIVTPYWEVEMMCHLLRWNLDLMMFPTIYSMNPVSSRDGADLDENFDFMTTNGVRWGTRSRWLPPCHTSRS
jgi:hypothetical protein